MAEVGRDGGTLRDLAWPCTCRAPSTAPAAAPAGTPHSALVAERPREHPTPSSHFRTSLGGTGFSCGHHGMYYQGPGFILFTYWGILMLMCSEQCSLLQVTKSLRLPLVAASFPAVGGAGGGPASV